MPYLASSSRDLSMLARQKYWNCESLLGIHPFLHPNILIPNANTESAHVKLSYKAHEKAETQNSQSK